MRAIGNRILYLRSLDIDREQFWALLHPFLDNAPTPAETAAWFERGELPKHIEQAAIKAEQQQLLRDQEPTRRQKCRM